MTDRRMLIGGEWCNARDGRTFDRFNPATGALASRAPAGRYDGATRHRGRPLRVGGERNRRGISACSA